MATFFERRFCRVSTLVDEFARELLREEYDTLVREKKWFESLLKNFEGARKLKLVPEGVGIEDLKIIICAYARVIGIKEAEIARKALERRI